MSERIKTVILIGIIGIVLLIAGFVMGSGPSSLAGLFSETALPDGAADISAVDVKDIHAIEMNLDHSEIKIKTGDAFTMSGTSGLFDSYVLNGTFYVGVGDTKHSSKALGINVPSKWVCGYGSYVLTIPPKAKLDQITINTSGSDIACDALIADHVNIQVKNGDIQIENLVTETASEINVTGGRLTMTSVQMNAAASITAREASIGNSEAAQTNVFTDLTLSATKKDISLYGTVKGTSSLIAEKGNITAQLCGSQDSYSLSSPSNNLSVASDSSASGTEAAEKIGSVSFDAKKGTASASFIAPAEKTPAKAEGN